MSAKMHLAGSQHSLLCYYDVLSTLSGVS